MPNNDSQDLGKGLIDGLGKAGKGAMRGKRMMKMGRAGVKIAAKLLKFLMQKVILVIGKALLAFIGPIGILVLTIIILLLLVVDSINVFDIFQRSGERQAVEILFDDTVLGVMKSRNEEAPAEIKDTIRATQATSPYPAISEAWLDQLGESMKISHAVPSMHHYYKNLKNKTYKPWHGKYKDKDISSDTKKEEVRVEFEKIIRDDFDYFYESAAYSPSFEWEAAPEEKKETHTVTYCTDEEGNTTTSESTKFTTLPGREIVSETKLLYNSATIPYKDFTTEWSDGGSSTSGNCETTVEERYYLYIVDDGAVPIIDFEPLVLIEFMTVEAPEGELTKLIRPVDLEYVLELAKEVDPAFPDVEMDFGKFIKCTKKNDISTCLGELDITGSIGYGGSLTGMWYPGNYLAIYKAAGEHYKVDWWLLASIHGQETGFSTNPVASDPSKGSKDKNGNFIGAVGHMQFMPMTWVGWGIRKDSKYETTRLGNILGDLGFIKIPSNISKYGGIGVDADGDGKADPWNIQDAIFTAAAYLSSNGYKMGNDEAIRKAIFVYNQDPSYVSEVFNRGKLFEKNNSIGDAGGVIGSGDATPQRQKIIDAAMTWVGNSKYVLGGGRTDKDIRNKICDCSSFVRWAYYQGGVDLGKPGNTSTQTLKTKGKRITVKELVPGDLIFWTTMSYADSHVGIYIGSGKWVGCNTSSGVAITPVDHPAYWNKKFHGHARRILD